MRLVNGASQADHKAIAKWVGERIPFVGSAGFGNCVGIMVLSNSGTALAGVVFHDWQQNFSTIALSIAADSPRWATRRIVGALLSYPFEQVGVQKLWVAMSIENERVLRLAKGLGFTREAVLARHFGSHGHAVISRMFRADYDKLYGEKYGEAQSAYAA